LFLNNQKIIKKIKQNFSCQTHSIPLILKISGKRAALFGQPRKENVDFGTTQTIEEENGLGLSFNRRIFGVVFFNESVVCRACR
jgi:hypothetical protein